MSATPTNRAQNDWQTSGGDDFLQLLANLYYSPRAPVFIPTNSAGANDFRFYLDLNRNGWDDPNGWVTNLDNAIYTVGGNNRYAIALGDPRMLRFGLRYKF